jgi:hypothetical protein
MISFNIPAVLAPGSVGPPGSPLVSQKQQLSCPYRESNRGTTVRLSVAAKPRDGYKRAVWYKRESFGLC